jgi:hypothetical protein
MTARCLALALALVIAAPAAAAAQTPEGGGGGTPFGPLPSAPPEAPAPAEPQPVDVETEEDGLGGTAFWLIIGTTGAIFLAIGFLIVRDMRRGTDSKRHKPRRRIRSGSRPATGAAETLARDSRHQPGSHKARAKAQQRAKTKAARKQRRRSRSR